MQTTVLRDDSILQLTITISISKRDETQTFKSQEFNLNGAVMFQVRHTTFICSNYYNFDFVKITLTNKKMQSKYAIKLSCPEFKVQERFLQVDDSDWQIINESSFSKYTYNISVQVEQLGPLAPFAVLYDDLMTDFKLQCEDGSVAIHKSCLAAISPVFRSKLLEINESEMKITDTNVQTLEDFKKCLYLNIVPEDNLEQLLLLFSFFELKALEIKCVDKMMNGMEPARVLTSLKFALKHNLMALFLGILQNVQSGSVKVNAIRDKYLENV